MTRFVSQAKKKKKKKKIYFKSAMYKLFAFGRDSINCVVSF